MMTTRFPDGNYAFNRTSLELKPFTGGEGEFERGLPFNRTSLELKLATETEPPSHIIF